MFNSLLRACAIFALAMSPMSVTRAADLPTPMPDACPFCTAFPIFGISSMSAVDAGGIYNGSIVTLDVVVTNSGAGTGAWQAELDIPSGYAFVDSNPCGGAVEQPVICRTDAKSFPGSSYYLSWPSGTDGTGTGDDLAGGASFTCPVRLIVNSTTSRDVASASVFNAPHYFCGGTSPSDSKTYTFSTTTTPTTDMAIAVSSSASAVAVGNSVDYTLTASNVGRQTGTGVTANFNFPNTLLVGPKNCPGASTTGGQAIQWAVGNVSYGGSATCVLTATAQSGAGSNAAVSATINAGTSDPNMSNNSASNTISITAGQADLAASISASATSVTVGGSVGYTLTALNGGPQSPFDARMTLAFPASLSIAVANCSNAAISGQTLEWDVGHMASGASASCTLTATAQSGAGTNATVTATLGDVGNCPGATQCGVIIPPTPDPNSANNTASKTIAIAAAPPLGADLSAAISANANPVARGNQVTIMLKAANAGPQSATSTQLTGTFPSQLQLNSASCVSGTPANPLLWNIGTLAPGANTSCSVVVTVIDDSVSSVNIAETVSSDSSDPDVVNNAANYTLQISPPAAQKADLAAAIIANASTLDIGDAVTFTLKAANLGPDDAASVQLVGSFPAQLQLTGASCAAAMPGNSLSWNIGALAAGASQTCTVQATLGSGSATSIVVSDSLSSATSDGNSGNDSASIAIAVQQPTGQAANLAIHLSGAGVAPGQTYAPGDILRVTASATNTSSGSDADNVVAILHLPDDGSLSGISTSCGAAVTSGQLTWTVGTLPRATTLTCTVTATVAAPSSAIAVSASIDASALGDDLSQLMDALVFPVTRNPKQISTSASGAPTTKNSTHVALSGNGAIAVFQSQETTLVSANPNTNGQDVYRVGSDGKAVLETLDGSGRQLIGSASLPVISADASIVAFAFAAGAAKQAKDAVVSNMWGGGLGQPKQQLDNGMGGEAPNGSVSGGPSVASADGSKKLVFCSAASNLVASDTNAARDVFLVDPLNPLQTIQLVSTDGSGRQLPGDSCEPKLSADGTKLVFTISAPSLYGTSARQVVRKDLITGVVELITTVNGHGANADSSEPAIDGDGSVVAFTSQASDLDDLGTPVDGREAFVSLAQSAADDSIRTIRRLRSSDGTVPNGGSQHAQLSNDGNIVVMQTSATNFFGAAKQADAVTPTCGAVAITTNFFSPAALGSSLCSGQSSNQNPAISGDGTMAGFDSNAPQPGTGSNNSNTYTQGVSAGANGVANLGDDFSGQWDDPHQSGQGLVIDVTNTQTMIVTWFVYVNGQPTWVQGSARPQAGVGDQAGMVVVQVPMGISQGTAFPRGSANVTTRLWGSISLAFADANTGTMRWTSSYAGFNSGVMAITHFLPVSLPAQDPAGASITACYSGNWYDHSQSGAGFEFEVLSGASPQLAVDWFAYGPDGSPVWLYGSAPIVGSSVPVPLSLIDGAQFPPKFAMGQTVLHSWGTATFTFTDPAHASVTWNSTVPGYGTGTQPLQPFAEGLLDRRGCQ